MMESAPHSSGTPNLLFNLTICHRLIQQILCYFSSWFLLPFLPPFCNTSHFSILREISQSLWRKASYKNINFQVDCRKWVTHERKKRSSFFVIFLLTFLCISVKHIDVISLSWPRLFLRGQNWCQVTYWCWCEALRVTLCHCLGYREVITDPDNKKQSVSVGKTAVLTNRGASILPLKVGIFTISSSNQDLASFLFICLVILLCFQ